jgi:hypothetical protein
LVLILEHGQNTQVFHWSSNDPDHANNENNNEREHPLLKSQDFGGRCGLKLHSPFEVCRTNNPIKAMSWLPFIGASIWFSDLFNTANADTEGQICQQSPCCSTALLVLLSFCHFFILALPAKSEFETCVIL